MPPEITLSLNVSEAISAIEGGTDHLLAALVTEMRDRFEDNVHVITGAMRASGSVVTPEGSDYAERVAEAAGLNSKASFAPQAVVGEHEAIVQVPIGYAGHEELGTSRRPGHPALIPAIESTVADADAIAQKVFGL